MIGSMGRARSNNRYRWRTSKYMPHQGKRECARRLRQHWLWV